MPKMNNEALVDKFREYLDKADNEKKIAPHKLTLFSLYEEMISLKNEIKIESRIVKQGLDRFQATAELIEQGNKKIDFLIEKSNAEPDGIPSLAEQPVLQGLLDLFDSVQASLQTLRQSKDAIPWFQCWKRSNDKILQSVSRGQKMVLDRIIDLLLEWGAVPMDVVRRKFDPHTMRAVGTDSTAKLEDGVVSNESRTGFTLHGEILRLADVRVNRL